MTVPAFAVEGLGHRFGQRRVVERGLVLDRPRRVHRAARAERRREDDAVFACDPALRPGRGDDPHLRHGYSRADVGVPAADGGRVPATDPRPRSDARAEPLLPLRLAWALAPRRGRADCGRGRTRRARRAAPRQGPPAERRPAAACRDRARPAASPAPVAARRADRRARYFEPAIHARSCPPALPRRRAGGALGHASDRRSRGRRAGRSFLHKGEVRADGGAAQLLGETRASSMRAAFETLVQERAAA